MKQYLFLKDMKPFSRLLLFIAIVVVMALFFSLLSFVITRFIYNIGPAELNNLSENLHIQVFVSAMKTLQIISQIGIFVIPPVLYAVLTYGDITGYFKFHKPKTPTSILWVIAGVFTLMPLVGVLTEWNMNIDLPENISRIEKWMKNYQEQNQAIMEAFLNTGTLSGLLVNLLMIAVLPAIGEELLFRGVGQQLLHQIFRNGHLAIFVTAILFSAFHMQFYGFFPRFLLGLALGYAFFFSGNIWLPIIMHFVNNGISVVAAYYFYNDKIKVNYKEIGFTDNNLILILSIILTVYVFYRLRQNEASQRVL